MSNTETKTVKGLLGKKRMAWFLGLVTVGLGLLWVAVAEIGFRFGLLFSLNQLELMVLLVFIAEYPRRRFFFNIPGWVIGVVIVGISVLGYIGTRDWLLLVKWTLFAMINAEELGIDSKNIGDALKSKKPDVMRFVGTEGEYGEELGLTKDWAARIVRHVGNYGEVYERNVGTGSKLGIPRGLNQLWNAGGILYAPPIR